MAQLKKLFLCLVPAVLIALFPLALSAQDTMAKQDTMGKSGSKMSATGCLKKGTAANGYYLKGDDGKTYELWGYKTLGDHVNHKVTVTGMEKKMPESMEKEKEPTEKAEAAGQPQTDLKVTSLKMVGDNCQ